MIRAITVSLILACSAAHAEFTVTVSSEQKPAVREAVTVTNAIPLPIFAVGTNYHGTMERIYGAGATSNTNLTFQYVAVDLSLRSEIDANTGIRLKTWYDILYSFWGRDLHGSFPFYQLTYTTTEYRAKEE